ncbi:MAG: hypothetical protein JWO37_1021 [Acidimicrobiales bacterium]|jgi:hypothetical protein|nr:hypothetical protein [Acidimicrobiales bacterium]
MSGCGAASRAATPPNVTKRRVLLATALGAVVAATLAISGIATATRLRGEPYVAAFHNATRPIDIVLAEGDGQSYAAIGRHLVPGRAITEAFGSPAEAAYREQRPLAAWLAALSGDVPIGLLLVAVLGSAVAAGAVAQLLRHRGADPLLGTLVAIAPGSLVAARWLMPDTLAFGLAAAALTTRRPALRWTLLAAAVLTRETTALVPLVLAAEAAYRRRPRDAAILASSVAPWAIWIMIVRASIGAWPTAGTSAGSRLALFGGLRSLGASPGTIVVLTVLVAVTLVVVLRHRADPLAWVVIAYALFALIMGSDVWHSWRGFSRPLLPVLGFGLVLLGAPRAAVSTDHRVARLAGRARRVGLDQRRSPDSNDIAMA